MPAPLAETIALLLLAGTLVFAIVRPRGLPEAVAAVPAAVVVVAAGILPRPLLHRTSDDHHSAPHRGLLLVALHAASAPELGGNG